MNSNKILFQRYQLKDRIGKGAESAVWLANDLNTETLIALKIYEVDVSRIDLQSIINKSRAINSRVIVPVYDWFIYEGKLHAVMPNLNGTTLKSYLSENSPLNLNSASKLVTAIAEAVKQLQYENHIHGDLSPDNIFIENDGSIKLLDPSLNSESSYSNTGTVNYSPPESFNIPVNISKETDIFSLASIAYEIYEGKNVFGCKNVEEYLLKSGAGLLNPKPFSRVPKSLRKSITKGLMLDRSQRGTIDGFYPNRKLKYSIFGSVAFVLVMSLAIYLAGVGRQHFYYDDILKAKVLDLSENDILRLPNVGKAPFYIRQIPNTDLLIVCNAHSPYLSVVSIANGSLELKRKIDLKGHHSHDFLLFDDNKKALVSSSVTNSVLVINMQTFEVIKILTNDNTNKWFIHPDALALSEKNRKAFVTNWRGGFVTEINLDSLEPVKKINVHSEPSGAAATIDGKYLFVSHTSVNFNAQLNQTEGIVTQIDIRNDLVVKQITNVGKESSDVKVSPNDSIAVTANFRGQSLSLIDVAGFTQIGNIDLNNGSPIDVYISSRMPLVYVANYNHPYVHVADLKSRSTKFVLKSKYFGHEVNGIILTKDEKYICMTSTDTNELICTENKIAKWLSMLESN